MNASPNLRRAEAIPHPALLLSVAKSLNAMISLNKPLTERLALIARRAKNKIAKAYAEYAFHEVAKISRLSMAVVNELGLSGLGGGEEAVELLGEAYVRLAAQLQEVLDRLARRISTSTLIKFTEVAEPLLKLTAIHLMSYARVVEDYSHSPSAARALSMASKDLLNMASRLRIMRSVLRLKTRTPRRRGRSAPLF